MSRQDGSDRLVSASDADDTGATILHADLDAFFASVELLERPELRGRPVIVGRIGPRSVVTAATYEARAFGVNSAMPMASAMRRCPNAIVVEPHFERYRHFSARFFDICRTITPQVEALGIDEGFLDVRGASLAVGSPRVAAALLRERVRAETGLICSVGVAGTKFVAKLASSRSKPDGLLVIPVAETLAFLRPMPVRALPGVGGRTAETLRARAISTIGELADTPLATLERALGPAIATRLHELANGRDPRTIQTDRVEQSMSKEHTFAVDLRDDTVVRRELLRLADEVASRLRRAEMRARGVTIKIRWADLSILTRSQLLEQPTSSARELYEASLVLYEGLRDRTGRLPQPIRLIGVRADRLDAAAETVMLWQDEDPWIDAEAAVDSARERFGRDALRPARLLPRSDAGE